MSLLKAFIDAAEAAKDKQLCEDAAKLLGTMGLGLEEFDLKIDWLASDKAVVAIVELKNRRYKLILTDDTTKSTKE